VYTRGTVSTTREIPLAVAEEEVGAIGAAAAVYRKRSRKQITLPDLASAQREHLSVTAPAPQPD